MIYYVEDDDNIRDLTVYALRKQGIEAEGFSCDGEFKAAVARRVPDAVLLDIMLPDTDGLAIMRRLRADRLTATVPIMMLTAKDTELIANGMVEGEGDLRNFGGRIYREAGRLAALVNDILTLSNLDEAERATEGEAVPIGSTEPIELSRAIYAVEQRLEQVARQANVTISHETKPVVIEGVSRLIDELIYNLASNAIRYNRPGGAVTLQCGTNDEGHPFLAVADTGIGIAPEEQGKVFERFYRVDKSRSKARGGTGLGLAIVKHAALYHHATLDLSSELGVGTTITVTFPIRQDEPFA